ncbi:MAG: hypothetical protein HY825_08480 [Acidobacteria bacterium]|nr:hypothetical protein [Acidobacteriota bacterium]
MIVFLLGLSVALARTGWSQDCEPVQPSDEEKEWLATGSYDFVVIADFTTKNSKVYSMPATSEVRTRLLGLKPNTPYADVQEKSTRTDFLEALRGTVKPGSGTRFVSIRGERVAVLVFYPADAPSAMVPCVSLTFKEEARQTRIEQDLGTLLRLVLTKTEKIQVKPKPIELLGVVRTLTLTRANLTLTAAYSTVKEPQEESRSRTPTDLAKIADALKAIANNVAKERAASGEKDSSKDVRQASVTIVTGPKEHLSLSANIALSKVSELKYNDETKKLDLKERPSRFLLGVDYCFCDLALADANGPVLKLLAEASGTPGKTIGAALGWRLKSLKKFGFELDAFSPFAGFIRTHDDKDLGNGQVRRDGEVSWKGIAGITFNLDKALEWAKGGEKK